MLNGALRDIALLLVIYEVSKNRRRGRLYEQQLGDGAALRRLQRLAPYPLVERVTIPQRSCWRTTPYAHHWLKKFKNLLVDKTWWEVVGW